MSRFPYNDDYRYPGSLRFLVVPDARPEQQLRALGPTNVRPLTIAEVLPPHLRSGSSRPVEEVSQCFSIWPFPSRRSKSPKSFGGRHRQHHYSSFRAGSLSPNRTPTYQPGGYTYGFGVKAEQPCDESRPQTGEAPLYDLRGTSMIGLGVARRVARNLSSELQEADTKAPQGLAGRTANGEPFQELVHRSISTKPADPELFHKPNLLTGGVLVATGDDMLQGEPGVSKWHGSPTSTDAWRPESGHARAEPATVLTSTLVARMEALRTQLLRISSTLTGVQERAAHLSSSMGRRSHAILHDSGFSAAAPPHQVVPPSVATAVTDLPTQRYYPPASYAEPAVQPCPVSPNSDGGSGDGGDGGGGVTTKMYVVSVSCAADVAPPPVSPPPPPLLQHSPYSLSSTRSPRHSPESPRLDYMGGSELGAMAAIAAAAAAAATAAAAAYPRVPSAHIGYLAAAAAADPHPQRSSFPAAVAVQMGALEGTQCHPFELGSPAGRTLHVALPEQERAEAAEAMGRGGDGDARYCGSTKPSASADAAGAMSTPHIARQHGGCVGSAGEGHVGGSAAAGGGPVSTAAAGAAALPHTRSSAFERQLDSAAPHELLTQRQSQQQSHGEPPSDAAASGNRVVAPNAAAPSPSGASPSPDFSHGRRLSLGAFSNDSSLDAERVHPWSGGGVSAETMPYGSPSTSPPMTSYFRNGGANGGGGAASGGLSDGGRPVDSRRPSLCGTSVASSLDAARVHPWSGADLGARPRDGRRSPSLSGTSAASSLDAVRVHPWTGGAEPSPFSHRPADSSLDLMAALALGSGYGSDGGGRAEAASEASEAAGEVGRGAEAGPVLGRGVGGSSWLLLSPTVVVKEPAGAVVHSLEEGRPPGAAGPAEDATVQASAASGQEQKLHEEQGSQQQLSEQQPWQQEGKQEGGRRGEGSSVMCVSVVRGSSGPQVRIEGTSSLVNYGSVRGVDEQDEPSVAVSPVSPTAMPAPYGVDCGAASSSGSSTFPTPGADLSFAFRAGSLKLSANDSEGGCERDDGGDSDGDGGRNRSGGEGGNAEGWLHRTGAHGACAGGGTGAGLSSRSHRLAVGDGNGSGAVEDDDEDVLQTPTVNNLWRLKLRYSGANSDSAAGSDGDSDAGGGGGGGERGQRLQRTESASSSVGVRAGGGGRRRPMDGLYDGYSEEDEEDEQGGIDDMDRGGGGASCGGQRRVAVTTRLTASVPALASRGDRGGGATSASTTAAAGSELYTSFSFPSPKASERAAAAAGTSIMAAPSPSTSLLRASVFGIPGASGDGGTCSARSSTSGFGGGGAGASPGTAYTPDSGSGGPGTGDSAEAGAALHSRPARPRIVVPSSPRSSLGGWSLPSPVPSPYTYGVVGARTPSSGGKANSFSLRKHLDLTVSSCLFAETSSEEGEGEEVGEGFGRRQVQGGVDWEADGEQGARAGRPPARERDGVVSQLMERYGRSPSPPRPQQPRQQWRLDRARGEAEEGRGEMKAEVDGEVEDGEEVTSRPREPQAAGEKGESEAEEVEEEDMPMGTDEGDDDATAAVAAWAYGDARRAAAEAVKAEAAALIEGDP